MVKSSPEQTVNFLDVQTGQQYGGQLAVELARDEAAAAGLDSKIYPLHEVLYNPDLIPEDSELKEIGRSNWPKEDLIPYGQWLLSVIKLANPEAQLTETILKNAYKVGLGPGNKAIYGKFDGVLWKFQDAIGESNSYARGRYSEWNTAMFKEYARKVARSVHRKPTTTDYQRWFKKGQGPSSAYIRSRVGGIHILNELVGYPNIHHMTEEDYVTYGVKVTEANPGKKLTRYVFDELSKKKRGPSTRSIVNHFGSLSNFQKLVSEEFELKQLLDADTLDYQANESKALINQGVVPLQLGEELKTGVPNFVRIVAQYRLVDALVPHLSEHDKRELAGRTSSGIINSLTRVNPGLSPADIEVKALALEVFDIIWPMDDHLQDLKVA